MRPWQCGGGAIICFCLGVGLLLSLLCRPEAQPLRDLAGVELERLYEGDTAPWQVFCHDSEEFRDRPRPAASLETEEGVETFDPALLEFVYPYQRETLLPAKVTATQLKGRPLDEEISMRWSPLTPLSLAVRQATSDRRTLPDTVRTDT